jgi:diamine N-acetyltransferase
MRITLLTYGLQGNVQPFVELGKGLVQAGHEGKGYGYLVKEKVIVHVKPLPGAKVLLTSYIPGDGNPSPFYYKLGFEETGEWEDDEKVLKLDL